jgi:hypothetical protein
MKRAGSGAALSGPAGGLVVAGLVATTLGFGHQPVAWVLNAFLFGVLLAVALLGGYATARPAVFVGAAEVVVALAVVQGVSPVLRPRARESLAADTSPERINGTSWYLGFVAADQAAMKRLRLPRDWRERSVYVRIDIAYSYSGPAGFVVQVNGEDIGLVNAQSAAPWYVVTGSGQWVVRVPPDVLARGPVAQVLVRPSALDPSLTIAGHGDPLVDSLGGRESSSAFFDGQAWSSDRLAGASRPPVRGTYRIWLVAAPRGFD